MRRSLRMTVSSLRVGVERLRAVRHQIGDAHGGLNRLVQLLPDRGDGFSQRRIVEGRCRCAGVPAAAEGARDRSGVDGVVGGAADQMERPRHLHEQEQALRIERVAQAVGDGADLVEISIEFRGRDGHGVALNAARFGVGDESFEQCLLASLSGGSSQAAHVVQRRALLDQPRRRLQIARGRLAVSQRAGVLVDAERQQRRFERGQGDSLRLQLLDQQGRRRAEPLAAESLVRREIASPAGDDR